MKLEVLLEVESVFGGDGIIRTEKVEEKKLSRTRKSKQTRSDIGVAAGGRELTEENVDIVDRDIQTFRRDSEGHPILRAGGVHGKLWGALREAAQQLRTLGVEPFTGGYKSIISMLNVTPIYIPIEMNGAKMEVQQLPQILAGVKSTMITMRFDVIPKGAMRFVISFPDPMRKSVEILIKQLENMGLFNKRRAVAKVISIKEVTN